MRNAKVIGSLDDVNQTITHYLIGMFTYYVLIFPKLSQTHLLIMICTYYGLNVSQITCVET